MGERSNLHGDCLEGTGGGIVFQPRCDGGFSALWASVCHGMECYGSGHAPEVERIRLSGTQDQDGMVTVQQNNCTVRISSIERDGMLALKLGAGIKAADPSFGMTREQLNECMVPERYTGRAKEQTEEYLENVVRPCLAAHSDELGITAHQSSRTVSL